MQVLTAGVCRKRSVALAETALAAAPRRAAAAQGCAQNEAGAAGQPRDLRAPPRPALAAHALDVLRGVCAEHPNPRRAYAAVAGRLLVPVLARAFAAQPAAAGRGDEDRDPDPGGALSGDWASAVWAAREAGALPSAARDTRAGGAAPAAAGGPPAPGARAGSSSAGPAAGAADAAEVRLAAAGLGVLDAALLAPAHVPELASLCAAEAAADAAADAAAADAAAPAALAAASSDSPAGGRERGRAALRSYHWQLFQARATGRAARVPLAARAPSRRHFVTHVSPVRGLEHSSVLLCHRDVC